MKSVMTKLHPKGAQMKREGSYQHLIAHIGETLIKVVKSYIEDVKTLEIGLYNGALMKYN